MTPHESAGSGAGRTAPVVPRAASPVIPDLTPAYQDDRLVLLVRDPRTVFAYWDCHPDTLRRAYEALPDGKPLLRLLMLGGLMNVASSERLPST